MSSHPTHQTPRTRNGGLTGPFVVSVVVSVLTVLTLSGCSEGLEYNKVEPYELTSVDDDVSEIVLTLEASDRLVMETAAVAETTIDGQRMLTVPYAALIYDTSGRTWVYLHTEPLTYVRYQVAVDYIEGDTVFLADGPDLGSDIAISSVAELYGAETGVGK